MKKGIILLVILLTAVNCYADVGMKFTEAQKKTLEARIIESRIAQQKIEDFINYLSIEHKVDKSYRVSQDLTGFEKIPVPPKTEVKDVK